MLMMDDSPIDQYAPFGPHTLPHAAAAHALNAHPHYASSPADHLQVPNYFDLDFMKRAHESATESANKKPRWSPGSSLPGGPSSTSAASGLASSTSSDSSAAAQAVAAANAAKFANYGYGPNAPHHQAAMLASQHQQGQNQGMQGQQGQGMQGMYGQLGMGSLATHSGQQQGLAVPQYAQHSPASMYMGGQQIPSITSAAAAQQPLQNQQTGQQASINGSYTAPASPFVPGSQSGASPSGATGFSFNGTPLNLGMMGGLAGMQGMQGMQGMMGMGAMNGAFGQNVGLGMGMGMGMGMGAGMNGMNGMSAFPHGTYGYDLKMPGGGGPGAFYPSPQAQAGMMNPLAGAPLNPNQRTVYIGNLPSSGTVDELLSLVRSTGPIESVRLLPEKNCAFISFLDAPTALGFFNDASLKKPQLHGMELKIGWGKATPVPPPVAAAVMQYNASRNVYLGGLEDYMTEEMLREDLGRFGPIDQIKILKDKNVGFVHFLSVSSAIKAVSQLSQEPMWQGKRVNYGKDRCTYVPKGQQGQRPGMPMAGAMGMQNGMGGMGAMGGMGQQTLIPATTIAAAVNMGQNIPFNPAGGQTPFLQLPGSVAAGAGFAGAAPNMRTVYLGNIHPDTTAEDLCNAVRGGVLQSIRYMKDKHIAFVTFIDSAAALGFFNIASIQGLSVNNRRLKIGWGKSSNPLPPALAVAVQGGATRNVYVGNIDDWDKWSDERLKRDFGEFGDIELINSLREKNCAWVNFTNISSAMKAIEAMRVRPEYAHLRVAYGKDRCANPPRAGVQGGGSRRNNNNAGGASSNMGASDISPIKSSPGPEVGELGSAVQTIVPSAAGDGGVKLEQADEYDFVYDEATYDADEADAREAEHDIMVPSDEVASSQAELGL